MQRLSVHVASPQVLLRRLIVPWTCLATVEDFMSACGVWIACWPLRSQCPNFVARGVVAAARKQLNPEQAKLSGPPLM